MSQLFARFPVLADGRILGFVAAGGLAIILVVANSDLAATAFPTNGGSGSGGGR